MRDLGEVIEHVHDAEIEKGPGTAPAATCGYQRASMIGDGLIDLFR
jgi:hypothetical protein